jgi:hypothetical protein
MVKNFLYRIINKMMKCQNVSVLYSTPKGVKYYNGLMKSMKLPHTEVFWCDTKQLHLGFDALKDEYTLVGKNVIESPHYGLMEALDKKTDIAQTDYCSRYRNGTLDSREGINITKKLLSEMKVMFEKRKNEIEKNNYVPIQVYRIQGMYYIADGKHRAALCAYLGKQVKCVEISNEYLRDSFRQWIYQKMLKNSSEYSHNIRMFATIDMLGS